MKPKISKLFVISAPSAGGKTSLTRELVKRHSEFAISVSLTTRAPRSNEKNGIDYFYVTKDQFTEKQQSGRMLETAEVHGKYYGTSLDVIEGIAARNHTPILIIDVQGWISVKKILPNATSVFILPPSVLSLWQRLEGRGTESLESRWQRLCESRRELLQADLYDHFVINDNFDSAYEQLEAIIVRESPSKTGKLDGIRQAKALIKEFEESEWIKKLAQQFNKQSKASGDSQP